MSSPSLERMLALLQQTHLYDLGPNSSTWIEFNLYSTFFDYWENKIQYLLDNLFVNTEYQENVDKYKKLFNLPSSLSNANMTEIIAARLAITNHDFTLEGVKRCLASGGLITELTEDFASNKVFVKILSDKGVLGDADIKAEFIQSCMPCHVQSVVIP